MSKPRERVEIRTNDDEKRIIAELMAARSDLKTISQVVRTAIYALHQSLEIKHHCITITDDLRTEGAQPKQDFIGDSKTVEGKGKVVKKSTAKI